MCWLAQGEVFGFALGEFGFTLYRFNPHCSHPLCNSLISNIRIF